MGYSSSVAEDIWRADLVSADPDLLLVRRIAGQDEGALDELYRRADVFLFPSLCESFGFPMVEALGYGLPIVAADTPINRELCGEAALYYAPLDASAAAQQLSALLGSPERLAQARSASERQYPRSHLGWPEYARRFLEIVQESLVHAV